MRLRLLAVVLLLASPAVFTEADERKPVFEALRRAAAGSGAGAEAAAPQAAAENASLELDGATLHPGKGLATRAGVPVMKAAYALDKLLSPHKPFTRDPMPADPRPLYAQAAQMEQELRSRFLADDGRLFLFMQPMSMGDMAIWQGSYAAMTILKHRHDEDPQSLAYAERAFDGLAMMYRPGLPIVRGILPLEVKDDNDKSPYYHREGRFQRLEDASVDQASGWLFGVILAEKYLPSRRRQAQELLRKFADDLIANGFAIKNSDGSDTRFGNVGKGLISPPPGVLLSLAALDQTAQNSPDPRYAQALEEFARKRQDVWGSYASAPALWMTKDYNHNIGMLALSSALLSEQDTERWLRFARGMVRLARATEQTGNSFWLYLTYWTLDRRPDMLAFHSDNRELGSWLARRQEVLTLAKKSMLEFQYPKTKLAYETLNSERKDLEFVRWPLSGKKTVAQPLPVWQRPAADFVWQRDQYSLDDWRGARDRPAREFTGMDFLLAYYLGLQTGALTPAD